MIENWGKEKKKLNAINHFLSSNGSSEDSFFPKISKNRP